MFVSRDTRILPLHQSLINVVCAVGPRPPRGAITRHILCAEELDRIEEGLDVINNDMKQAEIALKKMGKCCGLCTMPWKRLDILQKIWICKQCCGTGAMLFCLSKNRK
jgi:hypothetical protein